MGERKRLATVLLLLLAVLLVVAAYERHATLNRLERDLAEERTLSRMLQGENQELLEAVILLRQRVVEQQENLTSYGSLLDACLQNATFSPAVAAPRKRVSFSDLLIDDDKVVINVGEVTPGIVAPTRSMVPLLDEGTIVLEVTPRSPAEVILGDIIIYERDGSRIIHRVVATGWDERGWFAIAKGDNNPLNDPEKIRFPQIRGVVVGIIY